MKISSTHTHLPSKLLMHMCNQLSLSLSLSLTLPLSLSLSLSPPCLMFSLLTRYLFNTHNGIGVKILWNKHDVSFWSHWNLCRTNIPYTILISHILIRRNHSQNSLMQIESVPAELERAAQDFWARVTSTLQMSQAASAPEEFIITKDDIIVDYYFGP